MSNERTDDLEAMKCTTPEFRVSYPHMFKPQAMKGADPKYGLTMLFPKTTDITVVKEIAMAAAKERWGDKAPAMIKSLRGTRGWPFRDGDTEKAGREGYEGAHFIAAKNKNKPVLKDRQNEQILDESEFYPGCYARAKLLAYAYDNEFGKGIGFNLRAVQKTRDGERLGGSEDTDFEPLETAESDSDDLGF